MVPDGWELTTLEKIGLPDRPAIKAGPFGSSLKKSFYVKTGYKIYGQEQVIAGDLSIGDYYIDYKLFESLKACAIQPGDVLVSLVGTFGKAIVVPDNVDPGIINPRLIRLSFDLNRVEPFFIKEWLGSPTIQNLLNDVAHGGTMGVLNAKTLKSLPLLLPPLQEQKKIAEILGSVDESIASTQAVIDQTRKVKQGLLQQLLTKGIGHTKFKESAIGKIPESWEVDELSKVARVIDCKHRTPEYTESGFPVVRPRDIKEGSLDLSECLRTTKEDYEDLIENHSPSVDDVIYSRNATFGVAAIVETTEPFTVGQDVCIIVGERLKGRTLFYLLNSCVIRLQLDKLSAGSTFKRINLKDIRQFKVPIIPDYEQAKIVAIADSITAELNILECQLKQLHTLKEGLMQDLLNGKVRVKQTSLT